MTIAAAFISAWLSAAGYGAPQRAAVLHEGWIESRLQPGAVSRSGRHAGLMQWEGPRRIALARYSSSLGKRWDDLATQLRFMDGEIRSMPLARRFFAATSETAARALFCHHYLRAARC